MWLLSKQNYCWFFIVGVGVYHMGKVNTDTFQPSMLQASKILWNQHFKVHCGIFSSTKLMFTFSLFFSKNIHNASIKFWNDKIFSFTQRPYFQPLEIATEREKDDMHQRVSINSSSWDLAGTHQREDSMDFTNSTCRELDSGMIWTSNLRSQAYYLLCHQHSSWLLPWTFFVQSIEISGNVCVKLSHRCNFPIWYMWSLILALAESLDNNRVILNSSLSLVLMQGTQCRTLVSDRCFQLIRTWRGFL